MCKHLGDFWFVDSNTPEQQNKLIMNVFSPVCYGLKLKNKTSFSPLDANVPVYHYAFSSDNSPNRAYIQRLVRYFDDCEFWFQSVERFQDNRSGCFVYAGKNGVIMYEMNGWIIEGKDARVDNFRKNRENFDKTCPFLISGHNEYLAEDSQIFIRKYKEHQTIWQLNGIILQDERTEIERDKRRYYYLDDEMTDNKF